MNTTSAVREGYIPFRDWRTWYRVVGNREEEGKLPLLTLHGGPGAAHDYIEALALASARYEESLALAREIGDRVTTYWTLNQLARLVQR